MITLELVEGTVPEEVKTPMDVMELSSWEVLVQQGVTMVDSCGILAWKFGACGYLESLKNYMFSIE